jgi:hypothetical protein
MAHMTHAVASMRRMRLSNYFGAETMATSTWTDERRARQRELIYRVAPWLASTGPRSAAGKARSSRNACRPDSPRRQLMAMKGELAAVLRKLTQIETRRRKKSHATT